MFNRALSGYYPICTQASGRGVIILALSALVIDDEPIICYVIKRMLAHFGVQAETVARAEEALSLLQTGRYDVVLCDVKMPGMSGPQLRAAAEAASVRVPFVFVTGDLAMVRDESGHSVEGGYAWLAKPFHPDELMGAISCVMTPPEDVALAG